MELVKVDNAKTARQFIQIHVDLNKSNKDWIRPLDKDINLVFDPEKNKTFRNGEAVRWLLKNDQGAYIGRIAAFVNKKYRSKGDEQPTGGVGFFDCINDQAAANLLFDTAKQWLQERGMEAMDGPINFGERNNWWGLLVEGFHEPLYGMNYNPPYYQQLFEQYGFQPFFHQICFAMKVSDPLQKKFYARHANIAKDPAYSARHIKKGQLEKYAKDFSIIYNKAWAIHDGGKEMSPAQVMQLFKQMKPVMDERIAWFLYYNDEPIGFWVNLPELNQFFKHMNGRFGLLQKLQFLWLKWTGRCRKFVGIIFGVIPAFQAKGADAYMIVEGAKIIQGRHLYDDYELQWVGDFNPVMMNIGESLGTYRSRKLTTYRYLFDRTKPFKRHPTI
ncbi:hypothetical protein F0L74_31335 [Chitinophaga agrisoli]|uniref:N-acetyltransferase domain-containing protein n=1 Tax=Chitinophaga agrisoli TaxID=2607653 RepID=A0A5B2VPB7_9BACT|nr:hypothetical protein [Chitinophaga agrisoli]KAA2240644.1 hypothetical protein F0L74_31335 [Chitinophaga agrisoli]